MVLKFTVGYPFSSKDLKRLTTNDETTPTTPHKPL